MDTSTESEIAIVRSFHNHDGAHHYGTATDEPYHYRLACSGKVIDAMAYGGRDEYPTCTKCQRMDDPLEVETACYRVAMALDYRGNGGGWIYPPGPKASRAITQGWGSFAQVKWSSFERRGLIVRNANGAGWYVDEQAVAAAAAERHGRQAA